MLKLVKVILKLTVITFMSVQPVFASGSGFRTPSENINWYHYNSWNIPWEPSLKVNQGPLVCLIFEAAWQPTEDINDPGSDCNLYRTRGPNLFHQNRTVSWLMSMPRSCKRSSTFRNESLKRTYIITTRRMISGLVLKYLNGECFLIRRADETTLPVSSSFCLTVPSRTYECPK